MQTEEQFQKYVKKVININGKVFTNLLCKKNQKVTQI